MPPSKDERYAFNMWFGPAVPTHWRLDGDGAWVLLHAQPMPSAEEIGNDGRGAVRAALPFAVPVEAPPARVSEQLAGQQLVDGGVRVQLDPHLLRLVEKSLQALEVVGIVQVVVVLTERRVRLRVGQLCDREQQREQ